MRQLDTILARSSSLPFRDGWGGGGRGGEMRSCEDGTVSFLQAVCRGVPTITIPTANHGEQLLNASVGSAPLFLHAKVFFTATLPSSVRLSTLDTFTIGARAQLPAARAEATQDR